MSDTGDMSGRRDALLERLRANLQSVQEHIHRLRRKNNGFIYTSLFSSGIATVISGQAAAIGQLGTGTGGWRITCGIVALCTAVATIFTALHKQFTVSDNLTRAMMCAGKLNALIVALTVTGRDVGDVTRGYEEIIADYSEFIV